MLTMPTEPLPVDRPPGDTVTVVITRRVKAGCGPQYEAWLARLQSEARDVPGYLGVTTHRPTPTGPLDYTSVVRFASLAHLQAFENSGLLARHLADVRQWVQGDAVWQRLTGLEFWFTPPAGTVVPQPSRPRMVLLMTAVVFILVLSIGALVNAGFDALAAQTAWVVPRPARLLVTIAIEVVLMTYWLMPVITRRLAFWIYPQAKKP